MEGKSSSQADPHLLTVTIVIPSYQRRESLARLLASISRQLADPAIASRVDVVVVIDGSTDGSTRMASSFPMPVPLTVVEQDNRGLAAARNAGLAAARGALVLFLDDDLVPSADHIERHLRAHADGVERVVVAPCLITDDGVSHESVRRWWQQRYDEINRHGLDRFDWFSAANTSFPRTLLERMGGFDERFRGYGMEDYELALRLLEDGVAIAFEPAAWVTHHRTHGVRAHGLRRMEEGVNVVRFARMHPGRLDDIVATNPPTRWSRRLHRAGIRRPALLRLVWIGAALLVPVQARLDRRKRLHAYFLADAAAFSAGVASTGDAELYRHLVTG